jgi:hypothetical protein
MRQKRGRVTRVHAADDNFYLLTNSDCWLSVRTGKLLNRDQALRFIAKINQNPTIRNANDGTLDELARVKHGLFLFKLLQDSSKIDVV